jgi:predicted ATP-dependent protease
VISSLADIPVSQNFAITGSMNQLGEIQPIGGVNEKIEGFVKICNVLSKNKKGFGLIIPRQNVNNLMLHSSVQEAVKNGYVSIYPVSYVWEAFELMTGVEFGVTDYFQKSFTKGSALDVVHRKLKKMHDDEEHDHAKHDQNKAQNKKSKK